MRLILPSISNFARTKTLTLLLGSFLMVACATEAQRPASDQLVTKSSYQKVFSYPFDAVWRAAQLALRYPIAINNMDNGVLETDWIRGVDGFVPPTKKTPSPGVRYKIQMSLVKGRFDKRESVRVTIVKRMEKQRDFFSDPDALETDGLEEKVLFYRIERELIIEEGLKKATK